MFTRFWPLALVAIILLGESHGVIAEDAYPSKNITAIVPLAAGGAGDAVARVYSAALEKELKQSVIVVNRPGAGGVIGVTAFARSAPDGYTIMFLGGGSVSKTFFRDLTVDLKTDLTPVIQLARGTYFIVGNSKTKSFSEFADLVRANPGTMNYGSVVSSQLMLVELLKSKSDLNIRNVPYKSVAQARQALIVNEISMYPDSIAGLEGFVDAGQMTLLAVADEKRSPFAPSVPTLAELGIPGVVGPYNYAVWLPKNTPSSIVDALNHAFNRIQNDPEIIDYLKKSGLEPVGGEPDVHRRSIELEHALWEEAAKAANYQAQ